MLNESTLKKYQDLLHPETTTAYVLVASTTAEVAQGKLPHVQPGVVMPYYTRNETLGFRSALQPLPDKADVTISFRLTNFDPSKLEPITAKDANPVIVNNKVEVNPLAAAVLSKVPAKGVLQRAAVTEVEFTIGKDKVTAMEEKLYDYVRDGNPHYGALQYACARRELASQVYETAEKRSSPEAVARADAALSQREVSAHSDECKLRAVFSAESYPGAHAFDENCFDAYRMRGFTYANNLGMDVPMRTLQCAMQGLAASISLDAALHVDVLFNAMAQHPELRNYDYSARADMELQTAVAQALKQFEDVVPAQDKAAVAAVAERVPDMIEQARVESRDPAAQQLLAIMACHHVYGTMDYMRTQVSISSRFDEALKQQLGVGDTLQEAEQHALQRVIHEHAMPMEITGVIGGVNEGIMRMSEPHSFGAYESTMRTRFHTIEMTTTRPSRFEGYHPISISEFNALSDGEAPNDVGDEEVGDDPI